MKKYSPKQLKEFSDILGNELGDDFKCPQEYIDKFNTKGDREIPGGRAWIMWFIDQLDIEDQDYEFQDDCNKHKITYWIDSAAPKIKRGCPECFKEKYGNKS